ncbi:MAG: AAA family ATPase, partial [Sulfitobacter sp.]
MRLNRLDLIRYGRFRDAQIVLPAKTGDLPDVTVIYGANEAGKSTAFTGFLELLFGMKPRDHPYAFRFDRSDLLIGAELDLPGRGPTVLRRNGKKAQSLLDEQDRPVEEAILSSALHGIGRDAYVERFSLNDQGLREGGARIAGAQGDLGQLLHAGVSGLTSMGAALDQMVSRADQFHKKGGRATTLKTGKDRLTEIARTMREERLTPDRERKLREGRDVAQAAFDEADAVLKRARMRQVAGKAAQVWFNKTQEINRTDATLADYPDGPDLPKGAGAQIAGLVTLIAEKTDQIAMADEKIARHDDVIALNEADPVAEALGVELDRLDEQTIDGA